MKCLSCGHHNWERNMYCMGCDRPLSGAMPEAPPPHTIPSPEAGPTRVGDTGAPVLPLPATVPGAVAEPATSGVLRQTHNQILNQKERTSPMARRLSFMLHVLGNVRALVHRSDRLHPGARIGRVLVTALAAFLALAAPAAGALGARPALAAAPAAGRFQGAGDQLREAQQQLQQALQEAQQATEEFRQLQQEMQQEREARIQAVGHAGCPVTGEAGDAVVSQAVGGAMQVWPNPDVGITLTTLYPGAPFSAQAADAQCLYGGDGPFVLVRYVTGLYAAGGGQPFPPEPLDALRVSARGAVDVGPVATGPAAALGDGAAWITAREPAAGAEGFGMLMVKRGTDVLMVTCDHEDGQQCATTVAQAILAARTG